MAMSGEIDENVLDQKDLEELYSWIDAVPIKRAKKNIARDFSDGVSVAEIVHYFLPRMIELHNYPNANSTGQKRINWNMLNKKVFAKLNLKLSAELIEDVVEAKPGAVEPVLYGLKKKMQEMSPKPTPALQKSNSGDQLKKRGGYLAKNTSSGPPSITALSTSHHQSRITTTKNGQAQQRISSRSPSAGRGKGAEGLSSYIAGIKDNLSQHGNKTGSAVAASLITESASPDFNVNNGNTLADPTALPPAHLIYKGHKMVPVIMLEAKNKQIREFEQIISTLQKKVNFQDNLVQLKDNRVEDLTRELHNLRTKFQELTQTTIPDL